MSMYVYIVTFGTKKRMYQNGTLPSLLSLSLSLSLRLLDVTMQPSKANLPTSCFPLYEEQMCDATFIRQSNLGLYVR